MELLYDKGKLIMSGSMGYAGWVQIDSLSFVRATSCDIRNTQAITKPPVADGTIDNPVYHLGPMEVGGSIGFPAICGDLANGSAASTLWDKAYNRIYGGGFDTANRFDVTVKYADGVLFKYVDCVVDSYEISVVQSDVVNIRANIIGAYRDQGGLSLNPTYFPPNSRIVTWNDVSVSAGGATSDIIRSFSCVLANNIKRHYSLDGTLEPVLITPTKREITGKIAVMGRSKDISDRAFDNSTNCLADQTITFSSSALSLNFDSNCIFEMEEIAITNDLFETTVNYHVLTGITFGA